MGRYILLARRDLVTAPSTAHRTGVDTADGLGLTSSAVSTRGQYEPQRRPGRFNCRTRAKYFHRALQMCSVPGTKERVSLNSGRIDVLVESTPSTFIDRSKILTKKNACDVSPISAWGHTARYGCRSWRWSRRTLPSK